MFQTMIWWSGKSLNSPGPQINAPRLPSLDQSKTFEDFSKQTWMGINWHRCRTMHIIFICFVSYIWWIHTRKNVLRRCYKNCPSSHSSMSHCYCIQYAINTSLVGQCAIMQDQFWNCSSLQGTWASAFSKYLTDKCTCFIGENSWGSLWFWVLNKN